MRPLVIRAAMLVALFPTLALAADPKFDFGKQADAKKVVYKAAAQAGFVLTRGNAEAISASGGGSFLRDDGANRFALDVSGTYVQAGISTAVDDNKDGVISANEIKSETRETTRMWNVKARYDRFFTERNSLYINAGVWGNEPAGKVAVTSGQLGYARLLLKDPTHELVTEIGYDFSYEVYVGDTSSLAIHSARIFLGLTINATADTNIGASVEALFNLNDETTPGGVVGPFADTRLNVKATLTTKLWKNFSFRFTAGARYDHTPAPLPAFSKPYAEGFIPLANRLDSVVEAALVLTIL